MVDLGSGTSDERPSEEEYQAEVERVHRRYPTLSREQVEHMGPGVIEIFEEERLERIERERAAAEPEESTAPRTEILGRWRRWPWSRKR